MQKSCVYMEDLGESLFHCLTDGLSAWWTENQNSSAQRSHLFVVLITEYRSLLFAFQQHPSMVCENTYRDRKDYFQYKIN